MAALSENLKSSKFLFKAKTLFHFSRSFIVHVNINYSYNYSLKSKTHTKYEELMISSSFLCEKLRKLSPKAVFIFCRSVLMLPHSIVLRNLDNKITVNKLLSLRFRHSVSWTVFANYVSRYYMILSIEKKRFVILFRGKFFFTKYRFSY